MALQYDLTRDSAATLDTGCVVVGVFADNSLTPSAAVIDGASGGRISALLERGDLSGKTGKVALLHDLDGVTAKRVLVVGLGKQDVFGVPQYLKAVGDAARFLKDGPAADAVFTISEVPVKDRDTAFNISQAVIVCDHANYRYDATLGAKAREKAQAEPKLTHWTVLGDNAEALAQGIAIANGVKFARELGNLPPNICNPSYLADQAKRFADKFENTSCDVLDHEQMEELGMGSLLAVGRGSANKPKLIVLSYKNGGDAKPYVLVGKGITFDTGGINLKVQGGIEEMKFDMCGAATVMGTFVSAVGMGLPINMHVVVPAVENMPDADSYRPSDVLTSMSGKTIEVGNTDAEGRLILCDALTYAQRFEPAALVDVATLTGACMVALGKYASGLMSKDDDLANELFNAGEQVFDRAWRLPLWDEYQSMIDSSFADVYNIGGRWAGAITAGCFLARFTEGQRWAHLDIAGSASDEGKRGMATGRPVGLLSQWLITQSSAAN